MMDKTIPPKQSQTFFEVDGYEITATFSEETRPEVFQRIKQILLSASDLKSNIDAA